MNKKTKVLCCVAAFVICGVLAETNKEFLDFYMNKVVDPNLFLEYSKFYVPEWYVGLLSFDFDEDGKNEILVTSRDREAGVWGNEWFIGKRKTNDWNICWLPAGSCGGYYTRMHQFFRIQMKNGSARLAYGNRYGALEENTHNVEKYPKLTYIYLANGDMPKSMCVTNGLAKCLASPNFVSVERIFPSMYYGTNLVLRAQNEDHVVRAGTESLTATEKDGLTQAVGVDLRRAHQAKPPQKIKVIPADADVDGRCDAFVASDFDRTESGEYLWTLYLNTLAGWRKAEKPVYAPYSTRYLEENPPLDPQVIYPSVCAGTRDFYLVRTERYKPILCVFKYDKSELFGAVTVFRELAIKDGSQNPPRGFLEWFITYPWYQGWAAIKIERIICEEIVWTDD